MDSSVQPGNADGDREGFFLCPRHVEFQNEEPEQSEDTPSDRPIEPVYRGHFIWDINVLSTPNFRQKGHQICLLFFRSTVYFFSGTKLPLGSRPR